MDWVDGPFAGMEPGPDGAGADLLYQLIAHITQPQFVYVHDWDSGDALVFDNRTTIHAATWFDAERQQRTLWRTTVSGNPGPQYEGERPSWIPVADELLSSRRRRPAGRRPAGRLSNPVGSNALARSQVRGVLCDQGLG